ncbi:MAG TPA: GntR family transcriptional regulator [Azospirillum sp.]|nr:GntR family transcriptional regulator [Azospirillum sp.]
MTGALLDLRLALLRGETPCPLDLTDIGRPHRLRLQVQTRSALSDRLAVNLLTFIASGRLAPGARLPPERRIADAIRASRVSVRAALDRLKGNGYLEAVQGSGTRVVPNVETLSDLRAANRENLADLAEFREFLDGWLVTRALETASDKRLADIVGAVDTASTSSAAGFARDETLLRLLLADTARSPVLQVLVHHLARSLGSHFSVVFGVFGRPDHGVGLRRANRELAEALAARDTGAAIRMMNARLAGGAEAAGAAAPAAVSEDDILNDLAVVQPHPEHLRDRLVREIAALVGSGQLKDGDRLLSERRLADLFGVSRVSVRDALAALKDQGLITADERNGTRARPEGEWTGLAERLGALAAESLTNFRDLCEIRHHLEGWAAKRAALRGSAADLADLRCILAEMRRPIADPRRKIELDLRLHLTIARAAGSAVHLYVTEVLRQAVRAYFDYSLSNRAIAGGSDALLLDQHADIVDGIMARDPAAAERAMRAHCQGFRDRYQAVSGR